MNAPPVTAGVSLNLYLGQRVRIDSKHCAGATGRIQALEIARGDEPGCIVATVDLDEPIVSPACVIEGERFPAIETWSQHVPAVELTPLQYENVTADALRELLACTDLSSTNAEAGRLWQACAKPPDSSATRTVCSLARSMSARSPRQWFLATSTRILRLGGGRSQRCGTALRGSPGSIGVKWPGVSVGRWRSDPTFRSATE